jgi:hypothetical protein
VVLTVMEENFEWCECTRQGNSVDLSNVEHDKLIEWTKLTWHITRSGVGLVRT